MTPTHRSSDADNSDMPQGRSKGILFNKKVYFLGLVRKEQNEVSWGCYGLPYERIVLEIVKEEEKKIVLSALKPQNSLI